MTNTTSFPHRAPRVRRLWRPPSEVVFGQLQGPTLAGVPRIALLLGMIAAGAVLAVLRTPRSMWNLPWAEDGAVFLSEALREGPGAILKAYAGYLHIAPRLAAEFAAVFPLDIVPAAMTASAALVISLLACACFVFLETRIQLLPLRFAAWLVCLALPTMGGDVANNLANLHWFLLIAAFCAVTCQAPTRAGAVAQAVVVFGAVTSDALALLLIPFFVARWWTGPSRRDRAVVIAFGVGALLQLAAVVGGMIGTGPARQVASEHPSLAQVLDLYAYRVILVGGFGITGAEKASALLGTVLPGVALSLVILALVLAARADRHRRLAIVVFAASSVVFAALTYSLQWYAIVLTPATDVVVGLRYAVVPTALLLLALLQAADAGLARVRRSYLALVLGAVILLSVAVPMAVDYRATIDREAPAWRDALAYGASLCAEGNADTDGNIVIPTPPLPFGGMLFPCAALNDRDR